MSPLQTQAMLPVNPSASYSAELPSQSYPPSFFSTVVASMRDLSVIWEDEDDTRRSEIFSAIVKIRKSMVSTARITAIVYSSHCGSLVPISLTEPEHLGRDHRAPPDSSAVGAVAFMPMSPSAPASRESTRDMGESRSTGRKYRSVSRAEPTSSRVARASGVLSWNQYSRMARCKA